MGRRFIRLVVISLVVMYGVKVYGGQNVVLDGITVNGDVGGNGTGVNGTEPFNGGATGNSITLLNGANVTNVWGAKSDNGDVTNNRVVISGGRIGVDVCGGRVEHNGTVASNTIAIIEGTIEGSISGGWTENGDVTNNSGVIRGGSIKQNVYGGYVSNNGNTANNSLEISGGRIEGNIYGGWVGNNGKAINNKVKITGVVEFGTNTVISGGRSGVLGEQTRGNELAIEGVEVKVTKVENFETYTFYSKGGVTGKVETVDRVNLDGKKVWIVFEAGKGPEVGHKYKVIESSAGVEGLNGVEVGGVQGMLLRHNWYWRIENGGKDLELEVKSIEVNPKTKTLTQSMCGSIEFVSRGLGEEVGREINNEGEKVKTYMVIRGEGLESKIGKGVKERGVKMAGGVSKKIGEEVVVGGYVEYGEGKYDCKEKVGVSEVNAKGMMRYVGLGVIGKKEIGRVNIEGVFRVGQKKSDSESGDMGIREEKGEKESYDSKGMYIGGEIGGVYGVRIGEEIGLDIIGRVNVMGVGGEKVKMKSGEEVEYEGIKSGKIKMGCVGRYKDEIGMIKPYIGLWYEEEMLGEVKGKVEGKELPRSNMKGGSMIGEVGGRIEKGGVRIEIGVKGYAGNRQGVEGMFRAGYAI
jgi:hypothetical protein